MFNQSAISKEQVLTVQSNRRVYDVIIQLGVLYHIKGTLEKYGLLKNKILIITDDNVKPLYERVLLEQLNTHNGASKVYSFSIKPGAVSKSFDIAKDIYSFLLENQFYKDSLIISLGGGIVGDLAGFIAATFYRGVNFVQIPTSLLAQVDSSIGGKVAIHFNRVTNALGYYYPPQLSIIDPLVLNTLPEREFSNGMAELVKAAFINDEPFFRQLYKMNIAELSNNLFDIIVQAVKIKKNLVEIDEFEKKERLALNFGHTLAHALESLTNYSTYLHGEAVAIGCIFASRISESTQRLPSDETHKLKSTFEKFNLPTQITLSTVPSKTKNELIDSLCQLMFYDKKIKSGHLKLVCPENVGSCYFEINPSTNLVKSTISQMIK